MKKVRFQVLTLLFFIVTSSLYAQKVFYKEKYYTLKNDKIYQRGKIVTKGLNNEQRDSIYTIAKELYDERGKLKPEYKKRKARDRYKAPENFWEDKAEKIATTNGVASKSAEARIKKPTTTNLNNKVIAEAEENSKEIVQVETEEDNTKEQETIAKQEVVAQKKIAEEKQKEVENSAKELQKKQDNEKDEQENQRRIEEQKAREESKRKEKQIRAKEEKIKREQNNREEHIAHKQSKEQKKSAKKASKKHEKSVAKSDKKQEKRVDRINKKQYKQEKEIRKAEKKNKKTAKQLKKKEKALKNLEKATATLAVAQALSNEEKAFGTVYLKVNKEKTKVDSLGFVKLYFDLINNSDKEIIVLKPDNSIDSRINFFTTKMECLNTVDSETAYQAKHLKIKDEDYITVAANSKSEFFIDGVYQDMLACSSEEIVLKIEYNPFRYAEQAIPISEEKQKDFRKAFQKISKQKIESENIKFKLRK